MSELLESYPVLHMKEIVIWWVLPYLETKNLPYPPSPSKHQEFELSFFFTDFEILVAI